MPVDRCTLQSIAWREAFPALSLFSALRMALRFRALVLAAIAMVGIAAGWRLLGGLFSDPEAARSPAFETRVELNRAWPWEHPVAAPPITHLGSLEAWWQVSPFVAAWNEISGSFERVYAFDVTAKEAVYWFLCALWSLLVWSFFGGAISRMAAVAIARDERLPWKPMVRFVRQRLGSYFVAPLFPILGTFFIAIFAAVVGLIMRSDFGLLVAGIVWPLVLFGGFLMAFLLVGLFFGWPLMWGAISAEGTDSFGALSHSYSYVYQRPLQFLLYAVLAALIGVLGWFLVIILATWIVGLADWGASWGAGADRIIAIHGESAFDAGSLAETGVALIRFWNHCVYLLARAFIFSYFWSSITVIYFLLRRLVDATEMDEVFLEKEDQLHGLPPLKTGPDGVAEVADDTAVTA